MMTLAQPLWLLLMPLLLAALWFVARRNAPQDVPGANAMVLLHPDLSLVPEEKNPLSATARWQLWLNAAALILLLLALAQPQRIGELIPETPEGREIVMLIDTSKTMSIEDFEVDGQRKDRLSVLKAVVKKFVEERQGDRFGVIVFGSTAATMVPPTFDRDLLSGMINQVQVGIAGDNTALGDAIGLALKQLRERQALRPVLILFSDDTDNNAGDMTPSESVELAKRMGVAIYTVQIGRDIYAEGRVINTQVKSVVEPNLQQIAALTGGQFYRADSGASLQQVVADIGKLEQTVTRPSSKRRVQEWYAELLLLAVALFSIARLLHIRRMGA
jgi:Ca-activated chloride channel family protein